MPQWSIIVGFYQVRIKIKKVMEGGWNLPPPPWTERPKKNLDRIGLKHHRTHFLPTTWQPAVLVWSFLYLAQG